MLYNIFKKAIIAKQIPQQIKILLARLVVIFIPVNSIEVKKNIQGPHQSFAFHNLRSIRVHMQPAK